VLAQVITYYPAVVIVWEWYNIKDWCSTCLTRIGCRKKKDDNSSASTNPVTFFQLSSKESGGSAAPVKRVQTDASDVENGKQPVSNVDDYRWMERFLHNVWSPAIYKAKWISLCGFTIFLIIAAVYASEIDVSEDPTKWLPDSDPMQELLNIEADRFDSGSRVVQVTVLAGLEEVDRSNANPFNVNDIGNPRFVSGFDMSSPEAQEAMVANCETMVDSWQYVQKNTALNESGVLCPMVEFKNYVEGTLNESFPVPQSDFIDKLVAYTEYIVDTEGPGIDASLFDDIDQREERRNTNYAIQQTIRFHKNTDTPQLAYMLIAINTTIGATASASQIQPIFDYFEAQTQQLQTAPGYYSTFQSSVIYLWMRMEQGLVRDAGFAIFISLVLTLIIVSISTRDIRLSLLSTMTIGFIVLTMVATIVWLGWKISVIESICLTILVGLSVDYTIHLANAWQSNTFATDRLLRLSAALLEIGISVLAASVTTFLSAIPLLLTVVIFFFKFGVFIMLSVLWSTIFAFGCFTTLVAICGPVSNRNDFYWLYLWARRQDTSTAYFGKSSSSDADPQVEMIDGQRVVVTNI